MKLHACLLLCLFGFGGLAHAAEPVIMEVSSPLAVVPRPLSVETKFGRWFPVAVTLSNSGEPLTGEVSLRFMTRDDDRPQGSPTLMTVAAVDLPSNSRKRVWLYARRDSDQWDAARIQFQARGAKTLRDDIDVNSLDLGKRIILAVTDAGEPYKWLEGFTSRGLESTASDPSVPEAANASRPLKSLAVQHQWVPDRWAGLEGVDALVLHDFAHSSLSPAQIDSIRGYVAAGGTLIVTGGANWQRLSSSPLAELWPVNPVGSGSADPGETSELVRRWVENPGDGADRLGGAPVVLTRGFLKTGAVLLAGTPARPLAALRPDGAGRVVWLSFDPSQPPFIGWRGQENLWQELTGRMTEPLRFEGADFGRRLLYSGGRYPYDYDSRGPSGPTGAVLQVIKKMPQLQMPSTSVIAWFLAVYVFVLVPVNYFVLRAFDRREWAWFSVPIIAITFSLASYQAARRIKGVDLLRRHVTLVQGGRGLARTDAMLWIRSPRRAYFSVSSRNATTALSDFQKSEENDRPQETRLRVPDIVQSLRVEDVSVPMWTEAQFTGEGVLDMKNGLQVRTAPAGLALKNDTPYTLHSGVVVNERQIWRCTGELRAGDSVPLGPVFGESSSQKMVERVMRAGEVSRFFAAPAGTAVSDKTLAELAEAVLGQALDKPASGPVFIGWSRDAISPLTLEGEPEVTQNVSLFILRLPAIPALASRTKITGLAMREVNRGVLDRKQSDRSSTLITYEGMANPASIAASRPLELTLDIRRGERDEYPTGYAPPAPVGPGLATPGAPPSTGPSGKTKSAVEAIPIQAFVFDFQSARWQQLSSTTVFDKYTHLSHYTAILSPASRYIRRPDGVFRVQLRMAPGISIARQPMLMPGKYRK